MASDPLLSLHKVCRYYGEGEHLVRALRQVSFSVRRGEFVAIMGQSGSGKSTLMNILGCLDQPTEGKYQVVGQNVAELTIDQLSALRLNTFGFVFQRYQLLNQQSALDNVIMPSIYGSLPRNQRRERALVLLKNLGIEDRATHKPSQLSGGQQQRVSIARALINGAEVILADEPTGALDSHSGQQVLALLQELHRTSGTTVILITHDAEVAQHAERVITMKDGEIVSDSITDQTNNERLDDAPYTSPTTFTSSSMSTLESFRLAFSALHSNLFRTLLTLLGIIIGVAAVVSMMAIGEGGKQQVLNRIEAMGTNLLQIRPGGRNLRGGDTLATLSMGDAEAIATLPGVAAVAPERDDRTTFRHGANDYRGRVRGITPEYFMIRNWQLSRGVFIDNDDVQGFASVVVIGATVAEQLFPDNPNPVGSYLLMQNHLYQVIGILKAKGASLGGRDMDDEAYIPISTAQLKLFGSDYLSNLSLQVESTEHLNPVEEAITNLLTQRHGRKDFMVRSTASLVETVNETQDTLTWLLGAVSAISLLVGGIGVMNIMWVNVSERRREIGLRMATGARPKDILRQFNIEALTVCLLGGGIGVVLGLSVSMMLRWFDLAVAFSVLPSLLAFSTALLIGMIFGYAPARKAALLNPISALADE